MGTSRGNKNEPLMELRSNQTTACARKRNKWKRVKSPPETLEKEQGDAKGKKCRG